MNASKEECRVARAYLHEVAEKIDRLMEDVAIPNVEQSQENVRTAKRKLAQIDHFLETALKKLPSESSYSKDKKRERNRS